VIPAERHGELAEALGVALTRATATAEVIEAEGFEVDGRALLVEGQVCEAAAESRWGDVVVGLLACSTYEPQVYLDAWRIFAAAVLAAVDGSANTAPEVSVPLPPTLRGRRWVSVHGSAEELPTGALRLQVPVSLGKNLAVVLPAVAGVCHA
jgi:hypothetical protein